MADIQIINAELSSCGRYIYLHRTVDGQPTIERMPKEILAIRAAEYNLKPSDPIVLDIVLTESLIQEENPPEIDPLYSKDTIEEALKDLLQRVDNTKTKHNAPKEPQMRSLFSAAETGKATRGLSVAKKLLLTHADAEIDMWVKINRDKLRTKVRDTVPISLGDEIRNTALAALQVEAKIEDMSRSQNVSKS